MDQRITSRPAAPPSPRRKRRTQQERRDATLAALLQASLQCLCDVGLAAYTTTSVCERAGLSQGALFRYFPTKTALLAATSEHLFDTLRGEYESRFRRLPASKRNLAGGITLLWRTMSDPRLAAAYELYTAARTDLVLRGALNRVVTPHIERIHELADSLMPAETRLPAGAFHAAVDLAILAMQGLVLNQMVVGDTSQQRDLIALLGTLTQTGPLKDVS